MRHRGPSASGITRLAHAAGCIVEEPTPHRARRLRGTALHHREVRPLDRVRRELRLQALLRERRAGEDQEPGRGAVEAVHDEHASRPGARGERGVERPLALVHRRDREQARRLVDDEEIVVLVHEANARRQPDRRALRRNLDDIADGERDVGAPDRRPVHAHAVRGEHLLPCPSRSLAEELREAVTERARRADGVAH